MIGARALARIDSRRQLLATYALGVAIDGLMAWHFGWSRPLPAFLVLGVVAAVVTVTDLATRRIPNAVVLPAYPCAAVLLTVACAPDGPWWPLARAALGGALVAAIYLVLAVAIPGQLGLGDVRLGGLLGAYCGFVSWSTVVLGALLAFVLGALVTLPLVAFRGLGWRARIPFAPFMLASALAAVLLR